MHELRRSFAQAGLSFSAKLVPMLEEDPSHQTERRGCGYTQATRFLAEFINCPRSPDVATDLSLFADWSSMISEIEQLARRLIQHGWEAGWRRAAQAPAELLRGLESDGLSLLIGLDQKLSELAKHEHSFEARLLFSMIVDIIDGTRQALPVLAPMPVKPEIGSCSQAEEFFLEIAHGKIRRGGSVNLILDETGKPLLIEKMNLGESHSAMLLSPATVNQVTIPPGGLFALEHAESANAAAASESGLILSLADIQAARFLRLTTLAVPPEIRRRAFSAQMDAQVRLNMVSPLTTTLDDLRNSSARVLRSAA
ncbi:MAG: hypothetical protein KDI71_01475 [Xanthomonadales bacterium]|nr:hypothetical protein [Xanthomonadales bacterium]